MLRDIPGFYTGYYGTEQLLAGNGNIEAIFYQNDNMAVGGYEFCRKQGLRIPDDIGIAGWGDLPITSIQPYRLTSIAIPLLKIGQVAAEMLLAQINGHAVETTRDVGFRLIPCTTVRQMRG